MAQLQSTSITGSLIVTQGITGSFSGSITNAVSASYAATASYALNAGDSIWTGSAGDIYYNGGNVGIGTTSPSVKLDVNGRVSVGGGLSGNALSIATSIGTYTFNNYDFQTPSSFLITAGSSGYLSLDGYPVIFKVTGTERMRVDTSGNVGIGVTNPAYKLHVENNLNGGLLQTLRNTNTGTAQYIEFKIGTSDSSELRLGSSYNYVASEWNQTWIYAVNRNLALKTSAGYDIRFYAGGTDDSYERMRVTNGGNVGIGTTSPAQKLDVVGTIRSQVTSPGAGNGDVYAFAIHEYNGNNGRMGLGLHDTGDAFLGLYSDTGVITRIDSNGSSYFMGGNVGIGTTSPNARLTVVANDSSNPNVALRLSSTAYSGVSYPYTSIRFGSAYSSYPSWNLASIDAGYTGASWGGSLLFYTNNDSGETNLTERMRITSAGNVGIGTTDFTDVNFGSPALKIAGSRATLGLTSSGTLATIAMIPASNTAKGIHLNQSSDGSFRWYQYSVGAETFVLDAAGNVGIGTTSPGYKLNVIGTLGVTGDTTIGGNIAGARTLNLISSDNAVTYDINFQQYGTSVFGRIRYEEAASDFQFYAKSDTDPNLTLQWGGNSYFQRGNVGIGTTAPSQKFVVSNGSAEVFKVYSTGEVIVGTNYIYAAASGNSFYSEAAANFRGGIRNDVGAYLQIDGGFAGNTYFNGNVGIGTTTPSHNLHLYGAGDRLIKIENTGTYLMYAGLISNEGYIGSTNATPLGFYTNNVNRLYINTSGNIGIGTASPGYKLDVQGNSGLITINTNGLLSAGGQIISGTGEFASSSSGTDLNFRAGATHLMVLKTTGCVGIGTTAPGALLQVGTSNTATDALIRLGISYDVSRSARGGITWHDLSNTTGKIYTEYDGTQVSMVFGSLYNSGYNSNQLMVIRGNGNVGIGITTPNEKLQVAGNIVLGTTANGYQEAGSKYIGLSYPTLGTDGYVGFQFESVNAPVPYNGNYSQNIKFYTHHYGTSTGGTPRMTIQYDGNIGIGTVSPAAKLNIVESTSGYDQVAIFTGTGQYGSSIHLNATGTAGSNWRILSTANGSTPGGGHFGLYNDAAGLYRLVINPSGNVGIGTTNPSNGKLQVNGRIYTVGTAGTANAIFQGGQLEFYKDATPTYAASIGLSGPSSGGTNDIVFETYGGTWSERMRIATGGNVGIGTTSPASRLEVGNFLDAFTNSITVSGRYEYVPQFTFRLGQSGTNLDWTGGVISCGDDGNYNGIINFKTANAGRDTPTTKMVIKANGNVGIGTTSPGAKLEVAGNGIGKVLIGDIGGYTNYAGISLNGSTAAGYYNLLSRASDLSLLINRPSGDIAFYENNTTLQMVIKGTSGNVGIGTTAPSVALHIARTAAISPSIRLHTTDSTTNGSIQWTNSGNSVLAFIGSNSNISDGSGNLEFATGGTTTRMVINSAGNVGIGTTSPGYKLHVEGTSWFTNEQAISYTNSIQTMYGGTGYSLFRMYGNSNGVEMQIDAHSHNSGAATIGTYSNSDVFIKTNQTNRIVVKAGGSVGIGTTNPVQALHVVGNIYQRTGDFITWSNGDAQIGAVSGYALAFSTYNGSSAMVEHLRITSTGNVGIGVTAPAAKLQVSGSSNVLNVRGSGSAATSSIFSVDGTNGRLFEVSDDLSNSLFSVNTIAGLPVIEAFADYTVTMGTYGAYTLQVTGSRVGVGTSSPGYPLHVSGSVSGISIYATNDIAAFSDQSVKTDLQVIDSAVDRIKQINGYTYVRVDDLSNTRRAGVIAQEVQRVLPEVVSENNDGTLNVAYSNMIALLIEGMKEQQIQIDKLREDLEDLRYEL